MRDCSIPYYHTGLHGFHVIVGIGSSPGCSYVQRGDFDAHYYTPVEMVGLLALR